MLQAACRLLWYRFARKRDPMSVLILLERVLVPTLVVSLLLGAVASTVLGCALVFRTARAIEFMRGMNRWVSSRRALKGLEAPRQVGTAGGARSAWFAVFLLAGGAYVLYFLLFRIEIPRAAAVLGIDLKRWFLAGIALQTMRWVLVAGSVLAAVVGVLQFLFPRVLLAFEARMNKWYSTRQLAPAGTDVMQYPLDMLVEAYPRASGVIIAAASLLVAASMAALLVAKLVR